MKSVFIGPSALSRLSSSHVAFSMGGSIDIVENDKAGKAVISFMVSSPSLVVKGFGKNIPALWINPAKCADGAIIEFKDGGAILHVIESKGRVSTDNWKDIRQQLFGMILNCRAIMGVLQVGLPVRTIFHVAFKRDTILHGGANPVLLKNPIGGRRTYGHVEEWKNEEMEFDGDKVLIRKISKDQFTGRATVVL
ncbi:hypothetical protein [Sphingomonas sanguinis]|uniref:hypothetical protein n=1 Tax=Sphingomonas sanguinis TaxID=33051 RepID=UPI00128F0D66|nr:hypothetical protein [Sphingomonas sanguinis]